MKSLLLLLGILVSFIGFSQPPCGTNPAAGDDCANATPICELNGYCGNTSSSYAVDSWGSTGFLGIGATGLTGTFYNACSGASIENNSFLMFVASSTSISFDVWVLNSLQGQGIQLMIFSATNCTGNVTSYYCNQLTPSLNSQPVNASGLTPGNTYYIMVDGFAGDVCDYIFAANSGIQIPVNISPANTTICPGEAVSLSAAGGNGTYAWNATPELSAISGANVTATPPAVPGTYTYTVNSASGNPLCPSSTTATATVIVDNCTCTVTAGNSGGVCTGGTVNLTATNVAGAIYSWTGPNGFTSSAQNPSGVTPPATPGTYTYTVTASVNGVPCTSQTTVTVHALPNVSAGVYSPVCINIVNVSLTGTPLGGTFSGTGVLGSLFSPLVGSQTVTYTYTDGNGCMNSATASILVNSTPVVDAGTYPAVCTDAANVVLAGTPAGGTFSGTGVSGSAFDPSAGTQMVTYSYTNGSGCSNSATTTITVNPLPVVSAGTYPAVCASVPSVTLAGTPAGGTFSGTGVTGLSFAPSAGTQTVTYTFTNANGCTNIANAVITVNPLPVVGAGTDQAVCIGGSVTVSGTGAVSYTWNNSVSNGVAFSPAATQTYTVTGTDANGCQNTDQLTVTVNALPVIDAGADQTICLGTPVTLSGSGGVTYSWTSGITDGTSFVPGLGAVNYTVTGTDANGCQNTAVVTITVVPVPVADFSTNDPVSGYPSFTVNFDNESQFATSYSWEFGNGENGSSVTTGPFGSTFSIPGTYSVFLTASNGICSDEAALEVIVLPFEPAIIHIPNVFTPDGDGVNDHFFLDVQNGVSINVVIVNRWGNFVAELNDFTEKWDGTAKNGSEFSAGTYFFTYTVEGKDGGVVTGQSFVELMK